METKQPRIFRIVVKIAHSCLPLGLPPRAVHIQNQVKETLYLLLVQEKLFRELPQLLQHLLILRTAVVMTDPHSRKTVIPAHIQKFQVDMPDLQLA